MVTPSYIKNLVREIVKLDKARAKLVLKQGQALGAKEASFKGKGPWSSILSDTEEVTIKSS